MAEHMASELWRDVFEVEVSGELLEDRLTKQLLADRRVLNAWQAKLLNDKGAFSAETKARVQRGDQLVGDYDMPDSNPVIKVLTFGRPNILVEKPAEIVNWQGHRVRKSETALFLLRCSADSVESLVLSVLGYHPDKEPPEEQGQRWAANPHLTEVLEEAFKRNQHVFFILCFKQFFVGLLRMSSVTDSRFGGPEFWTWKPNDKKELHHNNFGVQ
ncbi:unnamed protein product [Symbiodinium sp. CCMP2456]|nr:unnamed protein product [Symbiodinium sp. CCMP2456]